MELLRTLKATSAARRERKLESYVPMEGDQDKFHKSQAPIRLILGGNQSGKTEAGAAEAVYHMLGQHPHRRITTPTHGWIILNDLLTADDIIIPKLRSFLPRAKITTMNKVIKRIETDDGSVAQFKSTEVDPKKFESAELDWVWFDEEPPEAVWQAVNARTAGEYNAMCIWLTFTPLMGMDWSYDELFCNQAEGEIEVFNLKTADNWHLDERERKRLERTFRGTDSEAARLEGEYVGIQGLVYKQWDDARHLIDPFDVPKYWMHVPVVDPHPNKKSVATIGVISPENVAYVMQEMEAEENFVVDDHVEQILVALKGRRIARRLMDPSGMYRLPQKGNTTIRDYYRAKGLPCKLANNDFFFGKESVETRLKQGRLYVFRTAPKTAWQMKHVAYVDPRKAMRRGEDAPAKQKKKNDDYADTVRYLCAERLDYENPPLPAAFWERELSRDGGLAPAGETGY